MNDLSLSHNYMQHSFSVTTVMEPLQYLAACYALRKTRAMGNESVPKIIINNT